MNVLVYNGLGVSSESLHHTIRSLRQAIGHRYDIHLVTAQNLMQDPWETNCRLLLIPGGRDLPYVRDLSGPATRRIQHYLRDLGGKLLGICGGAYFCCARVEFEKGTELAVVGERELRLCGATAVGSVYGGFEYGGEAGAHAVPVQLEGSFQGLGLDAAPLKIYFNGGCSFDFSTPLDTAFPMTYRTLARYSDRGLPAIVAGYPSTSPNNDSPSVILSGVHIEYDAAEMAQRQPGHHLAAALEPYTQHHQKLWLATLRLLGLEGMVEETRLHDASSPTPTPIYMFFPESRRRTAFLATLKASEYYRQGSLACERSSIRIVEDVSLTDDDLQLQVTLETYPLVVTDNAVNRTMAFKKANWSFSPDQYYLSLSSHPPVKGADSIGRHLLYAENARLAGMLPNGAILLAGDQLAGRGRGSNTWLSSKGCLQFTLLLHHSDAATLTLIQYLAGLAMIEAILGEAGYENLPIRLKWPNDIYTSSPRQPESKEELCKLAGILVNSQSFNDGFVLLIGMGTNVHDTPWTRSLNDLIEQVNVVHGTQLAPWSKEQLLARFAATFSALYRSLLVSGFPFELYYKRWLHSNQVVLLEAEQIRARIEGIDPNGYLIARPHVDGLLGLLPPQGPERGNPKAQPFLLQPDGNSFDMMQNLIKRKL